MKRILLLLTTIITLTVRAQTMVDTNKVWNVVACLNFGLCGTNTYYFGGDTIIGLYKYKLLVVDIDAAGMGFPFEPIAAREDTATKQIFFYDSNGEYLSYDFSLNKNDTFSTTKYGCDLKIRVDSVDTTALLNGELRKRFLVTIYSTNCFLGAYSETWIEGVGSLYGLTNVGIYSYLADFYGDLNCFNENDTLKYHYSFYPSCSFNTLNVSELQSSNEWSLNPNPFSNFTILKFKSSRESHTLTIFNMAGQKIKQTFNITGDEVKIGRDDLDIGIYFFQLMNDRRVIANGKLVAE